VIEALEVMGYKASEAREAIKSIPATLEGLSARVATALKALGK